MRPCAFAIVEKGVKELVDLKGCSNGLETQQCMVRALFSV